MSHGRKGELSKSATVPRLRSRPKAVAGKAVSACHDDSSVNFVNTDAWITNVAGKGGLSKAFTPAVAWRLPTKADYEQANANGLRFVLPDAGSRISGAPLSTYEWTASVLTASRANAWIFDSFLGSFFTSFLGSFLGLFLSFLPFLFAAAGWHNH